MYNLYSNKRRSSYRAITLDKLYGFIFDSKFVFLLHAVHMLQILIIKKMYIYIHKNKIKKEHLKHIYHNSYV